MNQRDWQNAYGNAPEDFHLRLVETLDGLEEKNMKQRYKLSTTLIAAVITVLLATGAALAANQLGIFEFFTNRADPILPLEGAEGMVLTGLGSVENELVTVTLEEAAEQSAPEGTNNGELRDAIRRLHRELRLVVVLHYMEGYKLREIAEILDIPIGTVKTRLLRAKRELREQLEEREDRA